jgi:acyl-CoA thioesterase-1
VAAVPDVPGLPRVLLLGDSISIAYTQQVRAELQGVANVHRPDENCGPTAYGKERLEAWLGSGTWDVIYFNFGLHDLKYLDAQENYVTPDKGRPVAAPEPYGKNLRAIVQRLHRTGARLIFATTTPVPAGATGRVEGSERAYNDVARRVMGENNVLVDDLHAYVVPRQAEIQLPHDVHLTPAGSAGLARRVAATIRAALSP